MSNLQQTHQPSQARSELKFLLLEARLDQEMIEHEQACIAKSGFLESSQLQIVDLTTSEPSPSLLDGIDGVFIGGTGDYSVAKDRPAFFEPLVKFTQLCLEESVPTLGLCYGFHLMAEAVGGRVVRDASKGESGTFEVVLTELGKSDILLRDFPEKFLAQQGHNDVVEDVPAPFEWLATSERCRWQGLKHPSKPFYGLQFHPELGRDDFMLRMRKYAHEYADTPERFKEIDDQVKETTVQGIIKNFVDKIVVPHRESKNR
jgi:GMP synthase (glutamine-hydrolysing)